MVGFLLFPEMEELDFAGPWEIFSVWNEHFGGPPCISIARSLEPVTCRYGLRVLPDQTIGEAPELRALVVPGGDGSKAVAEDAELLAFVREGPMTQGATCYRFAPVFGFWQRRVC